MFYALWYIIGFLWQQIVYRHGCYCGAVI